MDHSLIGRWRRTLALFQATEHDSAELRALHLQGVMRSSPALMVANVANALLLVLALGASVPLAERGLWVLLMVGYCGLNLRVWWRWRRQPPSTIGLRTIRRVTWSAGLLALLWSLASLHWFVPASSDERMLLGMLTVGMMCGGAVALAPMPHAALAYVGVFTIGGTLSLGQVPGMGHLQALQVVYGLVLAWVALSTAESLTGRLVARREATRQSQVVGLLLRDFEDHAADLLWEVGPDGRITHAAPRLAKAMGRPEAGLHQLKLTELLTWQPPDPPHPPQRASDRPEAAAGQPSASAGVTRPADGRRPARPATRPHSSGAQPLAPLKKALATGKAFSHLTVPVHTVEGPRWWSITAKPLQQANGQPSGWRGVISDVTRARETHRQLAFLAHFDSLTGLANRNRFREHLSQALEGAQAQPVRRAALFCLDLDHFKAINDTLGHAAGDAVLVTVAERLRAVLRAEDLPARLGGDEFAVVIAHAEDPRALHALARRLVTALCEPVTIDGQPVPIGVSLGIAVAPEHGTSLDDLMAHADLALYAAKETGRGRHEVYVPSLGDRRRRRLAIEQGLRMALARGDLSLHWQPRVDMATGRPVGAEALLRWQHPSLGELRPAEFVRVAEEAGLMATIGAWCLQQACQEALGLPEDLTLSVNVSASQLRRNDFLDTVTRALAQAGLPASRLELEVTEALMADGESVALAHLHALRRSGVRVALDDFGTGHSSLSYLRRFPFDTLKIDREFTAELMNRSDSRAIVRTVVELARTLGMQTLAEGVEERGQLELLRAAGCEAVQGYLIARPMPVAELITQLAQWPQDIPGITSVASPTPLRASGAASPRFEPTRTQPLPRPTPAALQAKAPLAEQRQSA